MEGRAGSFSETRDSAKIFSTGGIPYSLSWYQVKNFQFQENRIDESGNHCQDIILGIFKLEILRIDYQCMSRCSSSG